MSRILTDYTFAEVRAMLLQESLSSGLSLTVATSEQIMFTDDKLSMWENSGQSARLDLQRRVENFRHKNSHLI
jgi:hypothetical protein